MVLIVAALLAGLLGGSTPTVDQTTLAPSGSFFALAESGATLYAASNDGGSILLERSLDQGVTWTDSPVPYSLVAGGSPWTYAAVAADGARILVAAATAGTSCGGCYCAFPAGNGTAPEASCSSNSTILLASSGDAGVTWSLDTFNTTGTAVTSIEAVLDGPLAAAAWLGQSTACCPANGTVDAVGSFDGGTDWGAPQSLAPSTGTVDLSEGVEMAPDTLGIDVAFALDRGNGRSLELLRFGNTTGGAFERLASIPAPASWTLQGSSVTPAYLLTPTYLVPLGRAPFTALPFGQLQIDGGGLDELPRVVSLVPTGPDTLEVAATTSDNLGVDCWEIDTVTAAVAQSCHVPLAPTFASGGGSYPIVALIDRGSGWTAIGAASSACSPDCPVPAGFTPPPYYANVSSGSASSAAPPSVGTSICFTGCGASQGLVAYTFRQTALSQQGDLSAVAGVLLLAGGVALAAGVVRKFRSRAASRALPRDEPPAPPVGLWRGARNDLRRILLVWGLAWVPTVVTVAVGGSWIPVVIPWAVGFAVVVGRPPHLRDGPAAPVGPREPR